MGIWNRHKAKTQWNQGNDIYGVRRNEQISHNDAEGKLDFLDKNLGITRSGYYHSYFSGYSEVRVDRPGKPYKVERVYTAPWIKQNIDDRSYVRFRIIYGLLILLAIAAFIFGMTQNIGCNKCIYVAIPGFPTGILLFPIVYEFVVYAKSPRKMTIWEHYAGSVRFYRFCLAGAIAFAATSLSIVVYICLNPTDEVLRHVVNVFLQLISGALMFFIYRTEKNMDYIEIPNENHAPHGATEIH